SRGEGFGAEVKRRIMLGTFALSSGYYDAYYGRAQRVRAKLRHDFNDAFQKFDFLVTPTTPESAFEIGAKTDDPLSMYLSDIFTEHFIEHLSFDDAQKFLRDCRHALAPHGVLRLTTPNLDWVWLTQYHLGQWQAPSEAVRDCFWMNKAFRGWGHQFLYNVQTLTECLREAGFAIVEETKYGESKHDVLRGIERHEQYPEGDISHIVIVEASGVSAEKSEVLEGPLKDFKDAVSVV